MTTTSAATFCATLVDEWLASGVRHAVVAPGSRSTPLALALTARNEMAVHVFHDERSASFAALGIGRATGQPAVLLCTSGTAAVEFHAAIAEADLDEVPMIVCTADRPPELRGVSAPQAIDQTMLYGPMVRWFVDPGVPDDAIRHTWRTVARRAAWTSTGARPGPVHINLPFRDPLVGEAGPLPEPTALRERHVGRPTVDDESIKALALLLNSPRGVIVAGGGMYRATSMLALATTLNWPVLTDARSPARVDHPNVVTSFDELLRHPRFAADHRPAVVLRVGFLPASKVLSQWISASGATIVHAHGTGAWIDPDHHVGVRIVADVDRLCEALLASGITGASGTPWMNRWRSADEKAHVAIDAALGDAISEPAIARVVATAVPDGGALVVSSSMPIRDVEWYGRARDHVVTFANRGANGIDGVTSTAVGVSLADSERPVVLLIGDVAFLHDSNALIGLAARGTNITVVVVDNRGGGIFSFLPQREALADDRFEQLFGTPHDVDLAMLCDAHQVPVETVETIQGFVDAMAKATAHLGANVIVVHTGTRDDNVAIHDRIHHAVRRAL